MAGTEFLNPLGIPKRYIDVTGDDPEVLDSDHDPQDPPLRVLPVRSLLWTFKHSQLQM